MLDLANTWLKPQSFGNTDHYGLRLNNLTTAQRDALTGSNAAKAGAMIWNTTTGALELYNGTSWGPVGGTVTTAATTSAVEYGNAIDRMTVLTMTSFAVGTSGDNANLAIGAKFYTWPTGLNILVEWAALSGGITAAISATTDTPEVGIGTVIASGANATLTTATWENLIDGGASGSGVDAAAVAPDVAGTVFHKKSLSTVTPIIKATGGAARDLFLNVADGWADVTAAGAVTFTGKIILKWTVLS
jgi:hypothetical protein